MRDADSALSEYVFWLWIYHYSDRDPTSSAVLSSTTENELMSVYVDGDETERWTSVVRAVLKDVTCCKYFCDALLAGVYADSADTVEDAVVGHSPAQLLEMMHSEPEYGFITSTSWTCWAKVNYP